MGRLVSLFGGIQVAPRLQFLPDFSLLCRAKGLIFFRPSALQRTHNPLVLGSNPSGPTNQPRGPTRRHGLQNVPATWVTTLGRMGFRAAPALESPDRSIPDHNP